MIITLVSVTLSMKKNNEKTYSKHT